MLLPATAPSHLTPQAFGLTTINGLPAHVLLVHAVVVLVPLSAAALVLALRPSIAKRFGIALPAIAAAALVSVLAAMNAGGWLEHHVDDSTLVRDHTRIAGQLWPLSTVVLLLSVIVWWLGRRSIASSDRLGRQAGGVVTAVVIGVLSLAVAVGSVVQVVRIGESGSRAAWHDNFRSSGTGED